MRRRERRPPSPRRAATVAPVFAAIFVATLFASLHAPSSSAAHPAAAVAGVVEPSDPAAAHPAYITAALPSPAVALPAPAVLALHFGAAALALAGVFALGWRAANARVAAATVACVALHPVFFAQAVSESPAASSVLLSTALTAWGLFLFVPRRREVGEGSEAAGEAAGAARAGGGTAGRRASAALSVLMLTAALLLVVLRAYGVWPAGAAGEGGGWAAGRSAAGYFAGAWGHLKHLTAADGLWSLTLSGLAAMLLKPRADAGVGRPRIAVPTQLVFAALALTYAAALPPFGALAAHDALPALPPVVLVWVSTLWRRVPPWPLVVALVCAVLARGIG